jgi:hypothetical protein
MEILRDGRFVLPLTKLNSGLRKSEQAPINDQHLVDCTGAVVDEGTLQTWPDFESFDLSPIGGSFPYPQLFVFQDLIIGCNETEIYELNNNIWNLKITASAAGSTWCATAIHDFVYLSNGRVVILRDAETKTYIESDEYPTAMAIYNFNGQLILGSPDAGYI